MRVHVDGSAACLEFVAPLEPLRLAPCSSDPRQLWRYDPIDGAGASASAGTSAGAGTGTDTGAGTGALRYARDGTLCLDRFTSGGGGGACGRVTLR